MQKKDNYSRLLPCTTKCVVAMLLSLFLLEACQTEPIPKPRGYFRIDNQEHSYVAIDTLFPFRTEHPVYTTLQVDHSAPEGETWLNIHFPKQHATLFLSYKPINENLEEYVEDCRNFAIKHIPKSNGIAYTAYENSEKRVFGLEYEIGGIAAASPYQFFLTDSTNHFLRGSLYFNLTPNNDSLSPVIQFIKEDIYHFIDAMEWK